MSSHGRSGDERIRRLRAKRISNAVPPAQNDNDSARRPTRQTPNQNVLKRNCNASWWELLHPPRDRKNQDLIWKLGDFPANYDTACRDRADFKERHYETMFMVFSAGCLARARAYWS